MKWLEVQYSNDTVKKKRDLIFSSLKSKLNLKTNESKKKKKKKERNLFIFAKLEIILKPLSRISAEGF